MDSATRPNGNRQSLRGQPLWNDRSCWVNTWAFVVLIQATSESSVIRPVTRRSGESDCFEHFADTLGRLESCWRKSHGAPKMLIVLCGKCRCSGLSWRNIAIPLIDVGLGEQTAQSGEDAC